MYYGIWMSWVNSVSLHFFGGQHSIQKTMQLPSQCQSTLLGPLLGLLRFTKLQTLPEELKKFRIHVPDLFFCTRQYIACTYSSDWLVLSVYGTDICFNYQEQVAPQSWTHRKPRFGYIALKVIGLSPCDNRIDLHSPNLKK